MSDFRTKRMRVAPWSAWVEDPDKKPGFLKDLATILTSKVLAQLPPSMQLERQDQAAVSEWVAALDRDADVMAVFIDYRLVGLLILSVGPDNNQHLGYLLSESVWGKGLASELVRGHVSALEASGLAYRLLGGVGVENPASARVLIKSGFRLEPELSDDKTDVYVLQIGRRT